MIEAYFDESGTHEGAPFICVAGYLFKKHNVDAIGSEWGRMLNKYHVPYFHMADLVHDKIPTIYSHLTMVERTSLEKEVIALIKRYAEIGIALSIDLEAYQLLPKNGMFENPYSFLCLQVLQGIKNWGDKNKFFDKVTYFFETGAEGFGHFQKIVKIIKGVPGLDGQYRLGNLQAIEKKEAIPLQCADLLSWLWYSHNRGNVEGRTIRKDFKSLIELKIDPHHYDKAAVERWLANDKSLLINF